MQNDQKKTNDVEKKYNFDITLFFLGFFFCVYY